jgi:hypothetical protein
MKKRPKTLEELERIAPSVPPENRKPSFLFEVMRILRDRGAEQVMAEQLLDLLTNGEPQVKLDSMKMMSQIAKATTLPPASVEPETRQTININNTAVLNNECATVTGLRQILVRIIATEGPKNIDEFTQKTGQLPKRICEALSFPKWFASEADGYHITADARNEVIGQEEAS